MINISEDNEAISWEAPLCDVDFYTLYYTDKGGRNICQNGTLEGHMISYTHINGLEEMQLAAHRNNMTECSQGMYS